MTPIHAGLIALHTSGGWRGALIQGPSGCGKSDLALRALSEGFRLVADDRVLVWRCGDQLYGRAPRTLAGLLEVRGQGIGRFQALDFCRIGLFVTCGPPERLPEPAFSDHLGLTLPLLTLAPLESSAPSRLRRALQHLGAGTEGAYQALLFSGDAPRPGGDPR